jgi:hypothetical protein
MHMGVVEVAVAEAVEATGEAAAVTGEVVVEEDSAVAIFMAFVEATGEATGGEVDIIPTMVAMEATIPTMEDMEVIIPILQTITTLIATIIHHLPITIWFPIPKRRVHRQITTIITFRAIAQNKSISN